MEAATLPEAAAEDAMETVIRAAIEVAAEAAMKVVAEAAMEAVAEAAMEAVMLAAIEEATGIQSESRSENTSENVGIQGVHQIHYCLREAETRESQLQLVETCLRTCHQQRRTSRTALEVLLVASASL
jgi:hypothetical protein